MNVEAYQLEPLRRALQSARTNLLLADDVGLGKTIEAGLVIQELLLRHRARTAVIVCPPSLSLKWQDEMRDKFGLQFTIVNSELMAQVRRTHGLHANPFLMFPRVIVSMAWLPQVRAQRLLRDVYADGEHRPPASGTRSTCWSSTRPTTSRRPARRPSPAAAATRWTPSARWRCGRWPTSASTGCSSARPRTTATPESFTALLEMIDPRRFSRGALLDERALRDVTVRRLKRDLPEKGFKHRAVQALPFTPGDDEQEMFALLDQIVTEQRQAERQEAAAATSSRCC